MANKSRGMTAKQQLAQARDALEVGRRTKAARHIATALAQQGQSARELSKTLDRDKRPAVKLAAELDRSTGWAEDFLRGPVSRVEPFDEAA